MGPNGVTFVAKRKIPNRTDYLAGCSHYGTYRGADKSLARPGMKQATATKDFEFHISFIIIIGEILVLYIYIYI